MEKLQRYEKNMEKTKDSDSSFWGTWEELLLACAVNRHGTKSWESVAMEIQNRISSPPPLLLTPKTCEDKYHDLERRFMAEKIKDKKDDIEENKIPWLENLRIRRVAELRREVQRCDVSIESLQVKVKRLKEERENNLKDEENPDLKRSGSIEEKIDENHGGEPKFLPENGADISDDESDRENQSFNESNSTDPKSENPETGIEERFLKPKVESETASGQLDPDSGGVRPEEKPAGEGSYNGSSDTIAIGPAVSPAVKSPESKGGGEEEAKENSDVQSSASLSRKRYRKNVISGGSTPGNDDDLPVIKPISVKSHPLMSFLEIIRSHKYGSVFERKLESQESTDYQMLIRKHVDLEMVRTKLDEGFYSDKSLEFFRDLLLLLNNAIVFFPKNSTESMAAFQLREIVSKEMPIVIRKLKNNLPSKDPVNSVPEKPVSSGNLMVACRKRRSTAGKSIDPANVAKRTTERGEIDEVKADLDSSTKKKPDLDSKGLDNSSENVTTRLETKQRTREESVSVARGTRTSKGRSSSLKIGRASDTSPNPSLNPNSAQKIVESNENLVAKMAKKRSVANFLNRMKRSNFSNGTLLETLKKNSVNSSSSNGRGGGEVKKGRRDRRNGGEEVFRRGSGRKKVEEQNNPAKRSVGRPPKTAQAPPPPTRKRARR